MERQTVDFGIDLGTTNSAIARATPKGPRIIKNRLHNDTMPSVVVRTKSGQTLVGQDAANKSDLAPARQFKRLMGTEHLVTMADGSQMLPEELSAEVLRELKAAVQLRYDMQPEHVVVTVPAMFQQPQCEATHRAAERAGLIAVTLLQEPIAAATAYLDEDPEEGDYLVYDLGGGTFDVSIVRLRDGVMNVIAHGGDNYLGGSDFDREIYNWAVRQLERRPPSLPQLARDASRYTLMSRCEDAKKRLSDPAIAETSVDLGDLELPVAQLTLTRSTLEALIEEYVTRTIRLTRERVAQAGLETGSIKRVLLVGGPTMMPYVRERLKAELGIPLSLDQDPMTVVAQGAAIYASTLLKPDRADIRAVPGTRSAVLELHYEPVSPDDVSFLAGKVVDPPEFAGEVRITRAASDWDSGWIRLRNGAFQCELLQRKGATTDFSISLRDTVGNIWEAKPGTITLRLGTVPAKPVTPYKYGVALEDGTFGVVVKENQELPATDIRWDFKAAKTLRAGSPDELKIYFLEGMSDVTEDNVQVGELQILGRDLPRTLREGEKVEVRIQMDESRLIKARVSIPILDLDYDVNLKSNLDLPNMGDLQSSLTESTQFLNRIEKVVASDDAAVALQSRRDLEQIEAIFERVQEGDAGEMQHMVKSLADWKANLRDLRNEYELTALHCEALERIGRAEELAGKFNDAMDVATANDLRADADKYLRVQDEKKLQTVSDRAWDIWRKHYLKTEEYCDWLVWFLRQERSHSTDEAAYDECLRQAEDALEQGDWDGVRASGWEAFHYLPEYKSQGSRFSDAGLRL